MNYRVDQTWLTSRISAPRSPRREITEESLLQAVTDYKSEHGYLPTLKSPGSVLGTTWRAIDHRIRGGDIVVPSGVRTFNDFLTYHGLKSRHAPGNDVKGEITEETLIEAIKSYVAEHGKPPSVYSREPALNTTWSVVDDRLTKGIIDTSQPVKSLSDFLVKYGFKQPRSVRDFSWATEEELISQANKFNDIHGRYPTINKVDLVPDHPDVNWADVSTSFLRKYRKSLPDLFESLGLRNRMAQPRGSLHDLSDEDLIGVIEKYREEHGQYPIHTSDGEVPGLPGLTWNAIDQRLRRRSEGMSLYAFMERYGLKDQITTEDVASWIKSFHDEHGRYPNQYDSVPVKEFPRLRWNTLYNHLLNGNKRWGLPGGDTFHSIRQRHSLSSSLLRRLAMKIAGSF